MSEALDNDLRKLDFEPDPYKISLEELDPAQPAIFYAGAEGPYFKRLREEDPVHLTPDNEEFGRFWSVTRYEDIKYVDMHHEIFSSEGGITIGEILRVRAAMKPIATVLSALDSVDVDSKEAAKAFFERSDTCAVTRAGVVCEQMVAYVLADEVIRKFGGDTIGDLVAAVDSYRARLSEF